MSNDFDPWSRPDRKSGSQPDKPDNNQPQGGSNSPPDLDEVFNKVLGRFLKGSGGGSGTGKSTGSGGSPSFGANPILLLAFIALAIGLVWFTFGFYVIDQQERGVALRLGKYHSTLEPGLRWQPYFIDDVTKINVTGIREQLFDSEMLTVDENIVDVKTSVQYVIKDPRNYVLAIRNAEESLSLGTDSALRHVVGSTRLDDVITVGREQVANEVQKRIQDYVDSYDSGLQVSKVSILESKAPDDVKAAFDDVIKAREDKVRVTNQATTYENGIVPEARGKAKRMLEEAQGYRDAVIARAEGETQRFVQVAEIYRSEPEITRSRLYLQAIEGVLQNSSKVLVDTGDQGNNLLYLPLDQLRQRIAGSTSAQTSIGSGETIEQLADKVIDELSRRQSNGSGLGNTRSGRR